MNNMTIQLKKTRYSARHAYIVTLSALAAALAFAVYVFGARVAVQALIALCVSETFEYVCRTAVYKTRITSEHMLSAAITGILCALLCPVSATHIMPLFISLAASIIKHVAVIKGRNLINPAFGAAFAAEFLFGDIMQSFTEPFKYHKAFDILLDQKYIDASVSASPLEYVFSGNELTELELPDLILGFVAGKNGEISALLLLICGIVMLILKVSDFKAGTAYVATLFVMAYFFPVGASEATYYAIWQVLTGAVMIVAVFGINDPATTPAYGAGKIIFGIGCGLLTYILRIVCGDFDGAIAALLIMNLFTPAINILTLKTGTGKKQKDASNA